MNKIVIRLERPQRKKEQAFVSRVLSLGGMESKGKYVGIYEQLWCRSHKSKELSRPHQQTETRLARQIAMKVRQGGPYV